MYPSDRPTPKPQIRIVRQDQRPSEEMRKWLLAGHKSTKK